MLDWAFQIQVFLSQIPPCSLHIRKWGKMSSSQVGYPFPFLTYCKLSTVSQDCQHATVFSGVLRMGFILWKHLGLLWYNWYFFPVKVVHCIIIRYSWTGGSLVWDNIAGLSGSRREYVTKCSFWSVSRRHSQALKPFLFLPAMKVLILFDPAETIRL